MFEINRTNETKSIEVLRILLLTTFQIWYCCGHMIIVRTMKCSKFNCKLNLTKSHKVWWLNYRPVSCNVEKCVGGGGKKGPPPGTNRVKAPSTEKHFVP